MCIYIHTYFHIHTYAYVNVYIYIYIYVYIHLYTHIMWFCLYGVIINVIIAVDRLSPVEQGKNIWKITIFGGFTMVQYGFTMVYYSMICLKKNRFYGFLIWFFNVFFLWLLGWFYGIILEDWWMDPLLNVYRTGENHHYISHNLVSFHMFFWGW